MQPATVSGSIKDLDGNHEQEQTIKEMAQPNLKELFEKQAQQHTPIGRVEFTHEGTTMVYDYDIINLEQRDTAKAIYQIGTEMAASPPESISKLLLAGGHSITLAAFGFIFRRVLPGGELEPFSVEAAQGVNLEFVKNLPAGEFGDKLMECQEDFFFRAGVADLEQIRQLRAYAAAQEGLQRRLTDLAQGALQLLNNTSESVRSTAQEKSNDGSSLKDETARSSGTSRKTTRRSSKKQGK